MDPGIKFTAQEVLKSQWWIGAVALGVSLVATPIVRFIAYRTKVVDRPDDLLKPHGRPVAYLGGVAMCLGLLAGLGGYLKAMPDLGRHWDALRQAMGGGQWPTLLGNPLWNLLAVAAACLVITVVGLFDDLFVLTPRKKVLGQALAATILVGGGVAHQMAGFLLPQPLRALPAAVVSVSAAMCMVLVIVTTNATNLLDGLDGLCSGVTGIISLGFLGLAVWLAMWGHFPGTDELRVALCLAMAGAVVGFLPYNVPPASIFMGDAGSMLLGFFVATMMALFCHEGTARWFLAAWAVFALPVLDTSLAVVRRVWARRSIFAGDRSHLYDQLVDRGMTVRQVVGLFYLLATVAAGVGVVLAIYLRGRYALAIYAVLWVGIWIVFFRFGLVAPPERARPPRISKPDLED